MYVISILEQVIGNRVVWYCRELLVYSASLNLLSDVMTADSSYLGAVNRECAVGVLASERRESLFTTARFR